MITNTFITCKMIESQINKLEDEMPFLHSTPDGRLLGQWEYL